MIYESEPNIFLISYERSVFSRMNETETSTAALRKKTAEGGSFVQGLRDGLPICLGYLSVSFAFGIYAVGSGISILEALLISMMNLTSAGQLAAVPIIASAGSLAELALTQLVINMRYALMSVSLSQKLAPDVTAADRFAIAFGNTDEVFAVASSRPGNVGRRYLYGLIIPPIIGWCSGTLIGAAAGKILPQIVISSLGIAIYGMFIAIIIPPSKKNRPVAAVVLIAALLGCVFEYMPVLNNVSGGFAVIISAVLASVIAALTAPLPARNEVRADDAACTEEDMK